MEINHIAEALSLRVEAASLRAEVAALKQKQSEPTIEIRYINAGCTLDEVVGKNVDVHLEKLDDDHWTLIVEAGERTLNLSIATPEDFDRRAVEVFVFSDDVGPALSTPPPQEER